ncbi:MAG: TadE/TadG family type IV pilus assembly protein [Methylomicrobium sp.]
MKSQRGAALPEFALIGLLFFTLLFSAIEVGRWLYTWNTLVEATRRGARIAAVCPLFDDYIKIATVFGTPSQSRPIADQNSPVVGGLNSSQVTIAYYSIDDATNTTKYVDLTTANANIAKIKLVEVGLTLNANNWNYRFIAPIVGDILGDSNNNHILFPPSVSTTLPIESLGDRQILSGGSAANFNKCGEAM